MENKFKIGDLAKLKTATGPLLTVYEIKGNDEHPFISSIYWNGTEFKMLSCPSECLEKVS